MKINLGQSIHYQKSEDIHLSEKHGLLNFTHLVSRYQATQKPLLERGITQISKFPGSPGTAVPGVLISSSPHKKGSETTPWYDVFDPDRGRVEYFGDSKAPGQLNSPGNKLLLEQAQLHLSGSTEVRRDSAPLFFFERIRKGVVKFQGFGVIESVELVSQSSPKLGNFSNYKFTFAVLSLAAEGELLDWDWVDALRGSGEHTSPLEPKAWKSWLKSGNLALKDLRRTAIAGEFKGKLEQLPIKGTLEEKTLQEVYSHFSTVSKRQHFELLSLKIVNHLIETSGGVVSKGWVTQASSDRGVDFVTSFRMGSGNTTLPIAVIGQAKCESITTPTSGINLSRTVSRIQRGWIGAYVTTSYFSKEAQREVIEDQYPLLLVDGMTVAKACNELVAQGGYDSVKSFLISIDAEAAFSEKNIPIHEIDIYRDL